MSTDSKVFIGIGIVTLILIVGGVFILGGKNNTVDQSQIDLSVLNSNIRHAKGNPEAPVKIVEFADFECPACGTVNPIVEKVVADNQDKIYYAFRNYPFSTHKNSKVAAQAAEAAGIQNKFWEMQDLLFKNQNDWIESSNPEEIFTSYAQGLSLDTEKFKNDYKAAGNIIDQDLADGNKVQIKATPTFFINGTRYEGAMSLLQFQEIINQASTSK